jgi:hypothetical protein
MLNLDGKEYKAEDLNDDQKFLVNHLMDIEAKISKISLDLQQFEAAKSVFIGKLKESLGEQTV